MVAQTAYTTNLISCTCPAAQVPGAGDCEHMRAKRAEHRAALDQLAFDIEALEAKMEAVFAKWEEREETPTEKEERYEAERGYEYIPGVGWVVAKVGEEEAHENEMWALGKFA